jgi:hypothetical protein
MSTGGNSKRTSPLKVEGRNFTLWMSKVSKSSVLNMFLTPFEARILLKESTTLIEFSLPTWGEGWLSKSGDFWLDSGRELLINGDPMGDVATQDRVFPHYVPNSSIKHSKSDSKDRSQEILWSVE